MKRVLFSLLAMFAVGSLWAQSTVTETDVTGYENVVYNKPTVVVPGTEAVLPICLKNDKGLTGVQFSLVLPDDIEFVKTSGLNKDRFTSDDNAIFSNGTPDGNTVELFCALLEDEGFLPTDDVLCYVKIRIPETMEKGEYEVIYRNIAISGRRDNSGKYPDVNIEEDIISKIIVNDRLLIDENDEVIFAANDKINVTLTRTFQAGKWNTLVLPFTIPGESDESLTVKDIFGDDVKIAKWSGWTLESYDDATKSADRIEMEFTSLTPAILKKKGIEAGNVYLVKTSKSNVEISMDNVKLVTDITPTSIDEEIESGETGTFTGTFVKMSLPEEVFFISNDLFYRSVGKTTIKGFRAWFDLNPIKLSEEALSKMSINVDGETTAIEGINTNQRVVEGVYDLQGRKVMVKDGDINNLQRGLYIINGKKVAIK